MFCKRRTNIIDESAASLLATDALAGITGGGQLSSTIHCQSLSPFGAVLSLYIKYIISDLFI